MAVQPSISEFREYNSWYGYRIHDQGEEFFKRRHVFSDRFQAVFNVKKSA